MNTTELTTIDQLSAFIDGAQPVAFEVLSDKDERYRWLQHSLIKFRYTTLNKPDKGVLIRYLMKVSGYSRPQLTRLLRQYRETGRVVRRQRTTNGFSRRFTAVDIRLLAAMDERHNTPNGFTMKKLCERAWQVFGEDEYQRLGSISVAHLYNLRHSTTYTRCPAPGGEDSPQGLPDWRTTQATGPGSTRLYPHRYSASGRLGQTERGLSHQCC